MQLNPIYYTDQHIAFADSVRKFVQKELMPHINEWDEAETFPRELYKKAADIGLLGLGFDENYGGISGTDAFYVLLSSIELAKTASGGLCASLLSHSIGAPPINHFASTEIKESVLTQILSGEKISALAITEPGGGSDVAALQTKAIREGDDYIITGEKTFITSGMRADYYTVAVRTDPDAKGANGISMLLIDAHSAGITKTKLDKMGWWASDTAHLHFDQVRVPAKNLLGAENMGFLVIMNNFNMERFFLASSSYGFALTCYEEALEWAQQRKTFGKRLVDHQVMRHKLVDMATRLTTTRALLEDTAYRLGQPELQGNDLVAQICMLKNVATQTMQFCADAAVQTLGGMGFMRGTKSERIYREVKVNMIGGGAEEIMKDLASRQLGY
ncbi:acyl-CoA dehydrogenase family protein [Acinetobacter sp. ANC 4648]|uniref:acyl-CoA dehydrogenase family protein n=1 Tax=Acinetobacter sp. ANC 4648 TaxID=1977875 RepID=UPI000A33F575|nr:acyl-CoA dehydrogenase family protein [Acinetobacter sp. ANC 4648]OTG80069.1 acyl-CoA dehydrogenase [Acinetobacter sp. ANC 4648]